MTNNKKIYFILAVSLMVCYSPVYLSNYAFSDDWFYIYASSTDPLSVFKWDVLSGRPVYGSLRYLFSFLINGISSLKILRVLSLVSLVILCIYIYNFLRTRNLLEDDTQRAIFSLLVCLLPSFQVFNAWAVCFPYIASILLAGISYSVLIKKMNFYGKVASALLLSISFTIYQPTAMCFLFFAFMDICLSDKRPETRKLITLFALLCFGMLVALIFSKAIPVTLYNETISRTNITSDITGKIAWFFTELIKNAICNFDLGRKILYVLISLFFIGLGIKKINRNGNYKAPLFFMFVIAAAAPNLLVSESWAAYRTIIAIALIVTSTFLLGLFSIIEKSKHPQIYYAILIVVIAILTINNTNQGFPTPQKKEYDLLEDAVTKLVPADFNGSLYYRIVDNNLPKIARSTKYDEFGALSLKMPWAFKGMVASVRKAHGMNFIIPENAIISGGDSCPGDCIILDTGTVLSQK